MADLNLIFKGGFSSQTAAEESVGLTDAHKDQIGHALQYLQCAWSLVMIPYGSKGPKQAGWNTASELVDTKEKAAHKLGGGLMNMGLVHKPSGTCAIDVDDEAWTRVIFDEIGLDLDDILAAGPRILSKSGRAKVLFRAPVDLELEKISWPKPSPAGPNERMVILELRAGANQDVLPPSLHPDGHHYEWASGQAPWDYIEIPEIPAALLEFWRLYSDSTSRVRYEVQQICPWKPAVAAWAKKTMPSRPRAPGQEHQGIISKYNQQTSCESHLASAGYKQMGTRWLAPSSSSKLPGVVVLTESGVQKVYSHHASDPLGDRLAHDAFDLLVTLVHNGNVDAAMTEAAQACGVDRHPPRHHPDVVIDFEALIEASTRKKNALRMPALRVEAENPAPAPSDVPTYSTTPVDGVRVAEGPGPFPPHLLNAPGVLREFMDWMLSTAQKPQPILALAASLSIVSTVLAQKVKSQTGLRTNLYLVSVADTSAGKDHGRKCLKVALQAAGLASMVGGEEIASGQGLLARVTKTPTTVFQPDEFGLWMKSINAKNSSAHLQQIITNLMKLFTSAGTIYTGTEYADQGNKPRLDIEYPCVNLHATTTPEPLFDSFSSGDVASGNLNRLLILFAPSGRFPMRFADMTEPPETLILWMKAARALMQGMAGMTPGNPITIHMDAQAEAMFATLYEYQQDQEEAKREGGTHHLWGRCWEHAAKLALVAACAQHTNAQQFTDLIRQGQVVVTASAASWAIDFTKYVLTSMEHEVSVRVADSEFGQITQTVNRCITKAAEKGLTNRELVKACRKYAGLMPIQQDAVMESLKRMEAVLLVQFKTQSGRGKPRMAWVDSAFISDLETPTESVGVNVGVNENEGVQGD